MVVSKYSARRVIGSRIIESAAYCDQILLSSSQKPLLIESLGYCNNFYVGTKWSYKAADPL